MVIAWAVTLGVLLGVTWPLWTPLRDVPRIAPVGILGILPAELDWGLLLVAAFGIIRTVTASESRWQRAIGVVTFALAALMAMDQLRWQPWAYHGLLVGALLAAAPPRQAFLAIRLVAIAVYAFSALAKLNVEFATTLGQQMLGVMLGTVGLELTELKEGTRQTMAIGLPVGELLVAGLLGMSIVWRRLAIAACVAAVLMHAMTIAVLGPWGLGHSLGVLLWNVGFAWQTVLLFRPLPSTDQVTERYKFRLSTLAVLLLAVIAPIGTLLGWYDQWPGWALYAPGGERAQLVIHSGTVRRLPESLRPFVEPDEQARGPWRRVRVDDWVLAETWAPIYPQNRIVAALALGLMERSPMTNRIRVVVETAATTRSRERGRAVIETSDGIEAQSELLGISPVVVWTR